MIACSYRLVPLENLLRERLLSHDVLFMDETTVQVLKEQGKTAQSPSYMWAQSGRPPGEPVGLFDCDPSRSGAVPMRLLGDYDGYLMTDGYEGHNVVVAANGITHLACWAHARRKFVEAQKVQPKGKSGSADVALKMIGALYRVECDLQGVAILLEENGGAKSTRRRFSVNYERGWTSSCSGYRRRRRSAMPRRISTRAGQSSSAIWSEVICRSTAIVPRMRAGHL